ncbi:MAG: flagellin modification protein A [Ideonella sp. MAG2]|nr:MAG: flagellin modification protein A [Ideonella sp. MAG2]
MEQALKDRIVVVTGGCGLIGQSFVRAVADAGAVAVIADIDLDASLRAADTLMAQEPGRRIEARRTDITSTESVEALVASLLQDHGRIDGLVNNAYPRNKQYGRKLEQVTYDDFCDNMSRHVGGYFLTSQKFVEAFKQQGHGVIVNMASIYGVVAPRFSIYEGTSMTMPVEYAAIKAAVIHLTRYFAQYTKGLGIRVNSLSPGGVLDKQPEAFLDAYRALSSGKGMLAPDDLQGTLLFLLGDASKYVNGQNLIVDDGWSV